MFKQSLKLILLVLGTLLISFMPSQLDAQVTEGKSETRGNTVRRVKDIPIREGVVVKGNGLPTELFVIQLARFEDMKRFPSEFPKGTFLLSSPDHPDEKILFAGYFGTFEEAKKAAAGYRKTAMFSGAFARPTPLVVRYD